MKKVKITVLKCSFFDELVSEYAKPGTGPCPVHQVGQVYYTNGWQKPEGLCDNAWKSMMEYCMTLAQGGGNFYDGNFTDPKIFIASCNDGFRPVSFLIEGTDEEIDKYVVKY